jgi:ADP-heptose:LPS heptosyltransferase
MGITDRSGKVLLPLRKENDAWAQQWLTKEGITKYKHVVAIHPAASGPEKCWPIEYFIEVARQLTGKYQTAVIVIGGSSAVPLAETIKRQVPQGVWDMTGQTSLGQLASLLKRCTLLISNDSGPVHVADAVGTRVIAIFTRNQPGVNPKRWRPLGEKSVVLVPPPTNPQMGAEEARRIQIPPQKVLEAVDALFKLC